MRRLSETGRQAVVTRAGRRTRTILVASSLALCAVVAVVAGWAYTGTATPTASSTGLGQAGGSVDPAPAVPGPAAAPGTTAEGATAPDFAAPDSSAPDSTAPASSAGPGRSGSAAGSAGDDASPNARVAVRSEPEAAPTSGKESPSAGPEKAVGKAAEKAPAAGRAGKKITIDLTGYSYQDNTPPGSAEVSNPIVHHEAGGTGTFSDPITVAVPDNDQFGPGTKFYLAKVKRYVIIEDSGASSASESSDEHLDMWSDGEGSSEDEVDDCMSQFTGTTTAEVKPPPGRPVLVGPIYSKGVCRLP
jgi:hypothetical protein